MGRRSNYKTRDLMEIVLKYSDSIKHKIQYTELRDYARNFKPEFSAIEDRHFSRNKEISEKINDINSRRRAKIKVEENVVLYSSGIDAFFNLSQMQQREELQKTRAYFLKLERQIEDLQITNNDLLRASEIANILQKEVEELGKQISKAIKSTNIKSKYIAATVDDITMERILVESKNYKNENIKLETDVNFYISKEDKLFNLQDEVKKLHSLLNQGIAIETEAVVTKEKNNDIDNIDNLFPDL